MKPLIFTTYIFLFMSFMVFAQSNQAINISKRFEPKSITRLDIFESNKSDLHLAPQTNMKLWTTYEDNKNNVHDRYHQYHKNIKITGASVVVHSQENYVSHLTGHLETRLINLPDKPTIAKNEAIKIADQMMALDLQNQENIITKTSITPKTESTVLTYINEFYPKNHGNIVLAYEIVQSVNVWNKPIKKVHYLNAMTGQPIITISKIALHKAKGKGDSNYYGQVSFDHDSIAPNEFILQDLTRGDGIFVNNLKTNESYTNEKSEWKFTDPNDKAAIDVIYGAQHFYDLLKNKYNFNSLDNKGFPLVANVNNFLYSNAFWNGQSTTYGGGDCNNYKSFTTLDVVGHEFAHGLTEFNSGLIYQGESGAINESISDIFGKALEFYTQPAQFSWIIGNKIPRTGNDPFRSMSNPNSLYQPKNYKGDYWSINPYAVHTNSGVMNYWFYLMVNGGTGKTEKNVPYSVKAIGMDKALEIVFLLNTAYLTENSDYLLTYEYSKLIAEDLYGTNSDEYNTVVNAWQAVGLPEVPQVNQNLTFTFATDGDYDLNPSTCWENNNRKITLTITNNSQQTVPPGAIFRVMATGKYKYENFDYQVTLIDTMWTSTAALDSNESIDVVGNVLFPAYVNYLSINNNVRVNFPGTAYNNTFHQSIQYLRNEQEPANFFNNFSIYSVIDNICDKRSRVARTSGTVLHNLCREENFVFEFEYEDGNVSKSYYDTVTVRPNKFFNIVTAEVIRPDFSDFELTTDIRVHLSAWIYGQKYLIRSDTLDKYIVKILRQNEVISFDQVTDYRDERLLQIAPCVLCNTEIQSGALHFENLGLSTEINNCVPTEEFYDAALEDVLADFNFNNTKVCVDIENMVEPYLSFDARMRTLSPQPKEDFLHGIMVFENNQRLPTPVITDTDNSFKTFKIPLTNAQLGLIDISLYIDGSEGDIDNIFIYDKNSTSVDDIYKNTPFTITNPSVDVIKIDLSNNSTDAVHKVEIYNANGVQVYVGPITDKTLHIDCANWSSGLYLYKMQGEFTSWNGKIIVAH